ncbi:hypothetical protein D3C72_2067530 [compost metagenome]
MPTGLWETMAAATLRRVSSGTFSGKSAATRPARAATAFCSSIGRWANPGTVRLKASISRSLKRSSLERKNSVKGLPARVAGASPLLTAAP